MYYSESGYAEFQSEVPLHSFTGSSRHLTGRISLADSTVDFYLDLSTLDTGNNKRDKDMRETLKVDDYPFAEFFGKLLSRFDTGIDSAQSVTVAGEFTIHNVSRQLKLNGTLQKVQKGLKVEADWTLNMTDFNIRPPGILFYRVDEDIDIHIEVILEPTSQ
jgi:polyisoprenoid-binding protein YceI